MKFSEAQKTLCGKLNLDYDDMIAGLNDLFSSPYIDRIINLSILKAWDYFPWIISQMKDTDTLDTVVSQEEYDYPDGMISDSIRILRVKSNSGKFETYAPTRFEDYLRYREDYPDGADEIWADLKRRIYINPNAFSGAEDIELYGRARADNLTTSDQLMPFSPDSDNEENSGNEAIIKLAYSMALASDKMKDKNRARAEEAEAYTMLEVLAKRERESQVRYEAKDKRLFKRVDILKGTVEDELFNRHQW